MKINIIFFWILLSILLNFCLDKVQANSFGKESLKGIEKVNVDVLDFNIKHLSKSQIRTDVELKLRLAGIRVESFSDKMNNEDQCTLAVMLTSIESFEYPMKYTCYINIFLKQQVFVPRSSLTLKAITWRNGGLAFNVAIDGIRNHVKDNIDSFINDYLSVNQK